MHREEMKSRKLKLDAKEIRPEVAIALIKTLAYSTATLDACFRILISQL